MTPAEFADLYDTWADQQEQEDYRAGVIAQTVARSFGGARDIQPMDFFRERKSGNGHVSRGEIISAEESLEQWRSLREDLRSGAAILRPS